MKIGDYVRTKDYGIHKITNFFIFANIKYIVDDNDNYCVKIDDENIIKTSSNIIDLIEIGDYVNGISIDEKYIDVNGNIIVKNECNDDYYSIAFENKDIKSIVTKEQFESMKYRIGE